MNILLTSDVGHISSHAEVVLSEEGHKVFFMIIFATMTVLFKGNYSEA